jgi:hypothetical protein
MGIMKIECIAEVPRNASDVSIGWFLDCVELTNDSHVEISVQVQDSEMTDIRSITSRLTISPITDEYAGGYTCNLLGDDEYIPSDIFTLRDSMYYELYSLLSPCDDSGDVFVLAPAAPQKCADITENRTIPMSLSCAEPPVTTFHDTPVTSTLVYTSPPPSTSSSTPSTSSHLPTLTSSPTITVMFTTTPQKDPPTSLPGDLNSTSHYLAAVCAVLIMIIIILIVTFVLVKLCRRQSSLITVNGGNLISQHSNPEEPYYDDIVNAPATSGSNPLAISQIDTVSNAAYAVVDGEERFHMNINVGYVTAGDLQNSEAPLHQDEH